ncbi:MAG: hypothetical protein H0V76_05780 [Blastocatellia bacterium]|nr:hypothetical protein [Blastocatellia bacterium]
MKGTVLAIGGGEISHSQLIQEFLTIAEKPRSEIAIMTVATEEPDKAEEKYTDLFRELGFSNVSDVSERDKSLGLFDVNMDALPSGFRYDLVEREPNCI